jgi:hypothetical protein
MDRHKGQSRNSWWSRTLHVSERKRQAVLAVFSVLILVLYMGPFIYQETYVWQSTQLNQILTPSSRISCPALQYNNGEAGVSNAQSPLKIGLMMLFSGGGNAGNKELMERVVRNRRVYCELHNCELLVANDFVDKSRPPAWSKLIAAKMYLKNYDYILYLDMDMVILNMSVSIVNFINYARSHSGNKNIDIIMGQDWSGPNTGAWIVRHSNWSIQFFDNAWKLGEVMVQPKATDGKSYPFQYEQRVFHYMLATDVWTKRKLPAYPKSAEVNEHFFILPQCAVNSYSIHPLEYRANRFDSQYVPGDFLIHFPGKSPKNKEYLMNHYLIIAEKMYGTSN